MARSTSIRTASRRASTRLEEARDLLGERIAEQPALVDALARAYSQRGEYESAIGLLEHTLKLVRKHEDEQAETRLTVLLANVLIDSGSLPRARELLGSSIAKAEGATDPILQARLYWSQSRLHSAEATPRRPPAMRGWRWRRSS